MIYYSNRQVILSTGPDEFSIEYDEDGNRKEINTYDRWTYRTYPGYNGVYLISGMGQVYTFDYFDNGNLDTSSYAFFDEFFEEQLLYQITAYDNHPNPFLNTEVYSYAEFFAPYLPASPKNNPLSMTLTDERYEVTSLKAEYTYNKDGYPATRKVYNVTNDNTLIEESGYEYIPAKK